MASAALSAVRVEPFRPAVRPTYAALDLALISSERSSFLTGQGISSSPTMRPSSSLHCFPNPRSVGGGSSEAYSPYIYTDVATSTRGAAWTLSDIQ